MDRVRFGRALGQGTREAARALLKAADAATAPNPNPTPRPQVPTAPRVAAQATQKIRTTTKGVKQGTKRFGEAIWGPFAKVSRVVMLEVIGVLFSLFAIVSGLEVWNHRADLHAAGPARNHLFFAVLMFVVFAYFTLSSFVRASRRSRG
jgi:hypothetical protein